MNNKPSMYDVVKETGFLEKYIKSSVAIDRIYKKLNKYRKFDTFIVDLLIEIQIPIEEKIEYLKLFSNAYGTKEICNKVIQYYKRMIKTANKCNKFIVYIDNMIDSDSIELVSDYNTLLDFLSNRMKDGNIIIDGYIDDSEECVLYIKNTSGTIVLYDIWQYNKKEQKYDKIYNLVPRLIYPNTTFITEWNDIYSMIIGDSKYYVYIYECIEGNVIKSSNMKTESKLVDMFEISENSAVTETPIFNMIFENDINFDRNSKQYKKLCNLRNKRMV